MKIITKLGYWFIIILAIISVILLAVLSWQKTKNTNSNIKVGAVLPLSGFGSFYGLEMQKGMNMCNSGNIQFVYEDSASDPKTGVSAYNKVTTIDNVDITIVGLSNIVPAILPIAKEKKNFVITSIVSAPDVGARGGETVFRYFTDGANEATILAEFMVNKKDIKKLGVLYLDNEFGQTYTKSMQAYFDKNQLFLYPESFSATEADFSTALLKLKENDVEAIFIAAYDKQSLQIMKQMKEMGFKIPIFTEWVMANPEFHKGNEDLLEGVYFTSPLFYISQEDEAMKFNQDYLTKYNKGANVYSAIGCDLSKLIGNNNLSNYEELKDIKSFTGLNGIITQQANREFIFPLKIVQFVNGSVVVQN